MPFHLTRKHRSHLESARYKGTYVAAVIEVRASCFKLLVQRISSAESKSAVFDRLMRRRGRRDNQNSRVLRHKILLRHPLDIRRRHLQVPVEVGIHQVGILPDHGSLRKRDRFFLVGIAAQNESRKFPDSSLFQVPSDPPAPSSARRARPGRPFRLRRPCFPDS